MIRAVTCAAVCLLTGSASATTLEQLELRAAPQQSEILLVLQGMPEPRILELSSPSRLVLDLVGTRHMVTARAREMAEGPVERVRVAQFAQQPVPITRIVADLRRSCRHELQWIEGGLALVLRDLQEEPALEEHRDVLENFRVLYERRGEHERALFSLFEAIQAQTIRFDDSENLQAVLDDVAEYYAIHDPEHDEEFTVLVLGLLDEGRIRRIVDPFLARAQRERELEKSAARTADGEDPDFSVAPRPADRYWKLYLLAVEAERRWRSTVALSIDSLAAASEVGKPLRYALSGRNRAGRNTTLPLHLSLEVVPPEAASHDADRRSLVPVRTGPFVLRASTAAGALQVEQQVVVQPASLREVPMASLSPERGVMEVDERLEFTVTPNSALQRIGWGVGWEPREVLGGLTKADGGQAVVTIHARQSGIGRLLVTGDGKELTEAKLYVLPPAPSSAGPITLTCATAGALAGALVAGGEEGNSDVKIWLGYGAVPALALSAALNWWRYREQGETREKFLREHRASEATPPLARAGGRRTGS